jgi:hypothetical protein
MVAESRWRPVTASALCALWAAWPAPCAGTDRSPADGGFRVEAVNISVSADQALQNVNVSLEADIRKTDTLRVVDFLFGSSARLRSVRCLRSGARTEPTVRRFERDTLSLVLPFKPRPGRRIRLFFEYEFTPAAAGDTILLLDRGQRWYPLVADQPFRFRMKASVPPGYRALSVGNEGRHETDQGTGGRVFTWRSPFPVFKVPLVIYRSGLFHESAGSAPVDLIALSGDTLGVERILKDAGNARAYFTELLGEPTARRLTLIETPFFEGVNVGTGLLSVSPPSLAAMRGGDLDALRLVTAQQWTGAGAFAAFGKPGFWFLSLFLPHYLRLMYVRQAEGEASFRAALRESAQKYAAVAGTEADVPVLDVDRPDTREKGLILYAKGPLILDRLRERLGDRPWTEFLAALYRRYRGRVMDLADFRIELSRHDGSGTALALLDGLLSAKGSPDSPGGPGVTP